MSLHGSCSCQNIEVIWHNVDLSLVPRACQCDYCQAKSAAYVTKSATRFEVVIHHKNLHQQIKHGSQTAVFHECAHCKDIVFVTVSIDGEIYGALNANIMDKSLEFAEPVMMDFSGQSAQEKLHRWRQNWCYPVSIRHD